MTDDQTLEQLRVMTAVNDFYAVNGTTFDDFVVSYPTCCPSRATYLTGQYALHHGVLATDGPRGGYKMLDHTNTLPVWLQAAGYRTAHIGKYLNGYPLTDLPPGWDDWQGLAPPSYYSYSINDNGTIVPYGTAPEDYATDVVAERAVASISESIASGEPFFVSIAPFGPHSLEGTPPLPAPRHAGTFATEPLPVGPAYDEADMSDKPAYVAAFPRITPTDTADITADYRGALEALQSIDELFSQVIDALTEGGVLDNTIVVFTSDNGRMHGEHRLQAGKEYPYEESNHVPLLIAGPGFSAGAHIGQQTANVDLAPTIVGAARATAGRVMDGIDLRSLVRRPSDYEDRAVLLERYSGDCYKGVRTPAYMYARFESGEEELYDLAADPAELVSVDADASYAAVKADLAARTDALTGTDFPPCEAPPLTVSVGDATVTEARNGVVSTSIPVTLTHKAVGLVKVGYTFQAGTATAADFVQQSGSLKLKKGHTVGAITASISADTVAESDETFQVQITSVTPDFGIHRGVGTVTIRNAASTALPALSIGDSAAVEGDVVPISTNLTYVTVSVTRRLTEPLVVDWTTLPGSAIGAADYTTASGQLTIAVGQQWAYIPLLTVGDTVQESDEQFTVSISTASTKVQVADSTGTVTLFTDDA